MRILHAPSNIANQAWAAAQGLRALGHDAEVWEYDGNPYAFPADRTIHVGDDPRRIVDTFVEALGKDFDIFHFHFARSLIRPKGGLPWFWDLPVIRALGKKVLFTFHGTDVRLRSRHLEEDPWSFYRFADVPSDEELIARRLAVIRTYANRLVVASVLNLDFVPDAVYVPKIIDLSRYAPVAAPARTQPLVVHAPSSRATKGTDFVLKGFEQLDAAGVAFEYRLAEGLSHDELMDLFGAADVVVDNLLLGDCEVSAIEAMALGKPVVSRIRDEVAAAHPECPVVSADPDTFVERLTPLLRDAALRRQVGERGRAFVESTHSAPVVAARLVALYEEPTKNIGRTFPGWIGMSTDHRKLITYEERMQRLEVRVADLTRALEVRTRDLADRKAASAGTTLLRSVRGLRARFRRVLRRLKRKSSRT